MTSTDIFTRVAAILCLSMVLLGAVVVGLLVQEIAGNRRNAEALGATVWVGEVPGTVLWWGPHHRIATVLLTPAGGTPVRVDAPIRSLRKRAPAPPAAP